jgi:ATP-dependent protease HslVU (ClpYQ) ATPase subunit
MVEIEVEEKNPSFMDVISGSGVEQMGVNLQDVFGGLLPKNKKKRRVTVEEARTILTYEEAQRLIDMDEREYRMLRSLSCRYPISVSTLSPAPCMHRSIVSRLCRLYVLG